MSDVKNTAILQDTCIFKLDCTSVIMTHSISKSGKVIFEPKHSCFANDSAGSKMMDVFDILAKETSK